MPVLLQFGAGNIGRSLCANIFSGLGFEIVFVDTDETLVNLLNEKGFFEITVKENEESLIKISPVRALSIKQKSDVELMLKSADIISTAVGAGNLQHLFPIFAEALNMRKDKVNILICENVKNSEEIFRNGLKEAGFKNFERTGLIGTAIEKMVPTVPAEIRETDPLATWGESYNILQVNASAQCRPLPSSRDIVPVGSLTEIYERKLYIANLCHTLTSILGFLNGYSLIADALSVPSVKDFVRKAAEESAHVLSEKYPGLFSDQPADAYIAQFLRRLGNKGLKDTVYRGGRDIGRKLAPGERLLGPAVLYYDAFNKPPDNLSRAVAAALYFEAPDESGRSFEKDSLLCKTVAENGVESFFRNNINLVGRDGLVSRIDFEYRKGRESFK